ncbi:alpha/beta hydrolase [Nonomuraea sp. NPDC048916]|uniref:alpha/beta fold hydrolase n=1 Tax=Nonomuraea sp. NPDC048916 TaxID=3154232 RepID=UPI0033E5DD06
MEVTHSKDGTAIAFDRTGSGPALVYVAGALCDRATGAALAERLAPRFTVFCYDRRGRGDSGDTPPYAVEREVEDLAAVIDAAGGRAAVYGISSGAALALDSAAQGLAVTRLALYEPPFNPDDEELRIEAKAYAARLAEVLAEGRRAAALELFLSIVGTPAEVIGQMRHAPMWAALETLAPTLAYDSAVMGDAATGGAVPVERAATTTVPTLVMAGGASPAWMRDVARLVAGALPSGEYRVLDGQTHDVAADVLADALIDWLT